MSEQELVEPNGWMTTYTGKSFNLFNPVWQQVDIIDIAHGLSMICRYGGHTKVFYSVAQHSLMVEQLCPEEIKLEALLHDATEAYCGDLIRPIKVSMPNYKDMESKLHDAIAKRFGLRYDNFGNMSEEYVHKIIKDADNRALVTEKRDLKENAPIWSGLEEIEPLAEKIVPMTSNKAKKAFFKRFTELNNARKKKANQYSHWKK